MPTSRRLADLFRSIATDDHSSAMSIATEICRSEEQKGHRSAARILRGALNGNGGVRLAGHPDPATIRDLREVTVASTALVQLPADVSLTDVVLVPSARRELETVIRECTHQEKLARRGIAPRRKLLFHGPPGCGKSMTARALGAELRLPIFVVRFDAVIGAYLGQTAIHLRQLFHFAETTACVLLLDELDALGKQRGSPLDVGELDRIVIALMQELEHSKPIGLIVGTSNLPGILDGALWRRFDLNLQFRAPTRRVLQVFGKHVAESKKVTLTADVARRIASSESFASAEAVVIAAARQQILRNL